MRLSDSDLENVPEVTVEDVEEAVLDRLGFSRAELDALDVPDRLWLLRESALRLAAAAAEFRSRLQLTLSEYLAGEPDDRGTLVTVEEMTVNNTRLREERPEFWEQFSYVPASEAQRMQGRTNQRDALRTLYDVDVLPEERVRIQDLRDYLPRDEVGRYLVGTAKITQTYLLLRDSDGIERGTAGYPPREAGPDAE